MSSQFELFPTHGHGPDWTARLQEGICPGKDPLDNACTCPDLVYATRIRVKTSTTIASRLYCGCCDLAVTTPKST